MVLGWVKRIFSGDLSEESKTKSDVDSIHKESQNISSGDKRTERKRIKEHGRRQRARESQLSRDLHKEDSKWIARGGFSFGGGGA
jgi:hypothetical protein